MREPVDRDGQALEELQGGAVMAHPDAEYDVFKRACRAHFGLISPRPQGPDFDFRRQANQPIR